jgi:hypothetical protein
MTTLMEASSVDVAFGSFVELQQTTAPDRNPKK